MFFSFLWRQHSSTSKSAEFDETLRQREDLSQADLLKERFRREQAAKQNSDRYWHEETIQGEKRRWNYRSEMVNRLSLNRDHKLVWVSFGVIILVGFSSFVLVKARVIETRRKQMNEREQIRRALEAEKAKNAGVVG